MFLKDELFKSWGKESMINYFKNEGISDLQTLCTLPFEKFKNFISKHDNVMEALDLKESWEQWKNEYSEFKEVVSFFLF